MIYQLYNRLTSGKEKRGFLRFWTRLSANILIYLLALTPDRKKDSKDNRTPILISLTSFPARIGQLWKIIEILLRQQGDLPRVNVVLWLSEEQFSSKASLPQRLLRQEKRGLQIRLMSDNLMPHKKYYYAFQEFPDHIVITVDDDVLYPLDLIQKLYKTHLLHPQSVCCNRGRIIPQEKIADTNADISYHRWKIVHQTDEATTNDRILPTGVGGVLYPPHCYDERIFDIDAIKRTCLVGDDLWLNFMCRLKGTHIVHSPNQTRYITLFAWKKQSLFKSNVDNSQNDRQIAQISEWAVPHVGKTFYDGL